VARVPAESKAAVGQSIELALDMAKVAVFDADSGANLTIPAAAE
jgi:multiple sugar transport system ATP-binding protein